MDLLTAMGWLSMGASGPGNTPPTWLASLLRKLLEEKYGQGNVPGVRRISADIAEANQGQGISHGHVHNLLTGEADNLTDKTRNLLARFFGKQASDFFPPQSIQEPSPDVQALAARLATFDAAQIAAIEQAIEIISVRMDDKQQ